MVLPVSMFVIWSIMIRHLPHESVCDNDNIIELDDSLSVSIMLDCVLNQLLVTCIKRRLRFTCCFPNFLGSIGYTHFG